MSKAKLVSNTQIYLDCRKLIDEILDIVPNFPRAYKFTIGNKMPDFGRLRLTERANSYLLKMGRALSFIVLASGILPGCESGTKLRVQRDQRVEFEPQQRQREQQH